MDNKDPFDELLMHCLDDGKTRVAESKTAKDKVIGTIVNCGYCNEVISINYRYCPNCGAATAEKSNENSSGFTPMVQQKKAFKVTLLDVDRDFSFNGEYLTRVRVRIQNLTETRLHLSLTCVDSVIINTSGQQFGTLDSDDVDLPELIENWFYIYPHAFREGILLFPEISERIKSVYICCNPQNTENEEVFLFDID